MSAPIRLKRKARGERPYFFADPNVDRVIAMVMGLAGEVAVMRDRLDTLERLLERGATLRRSDIDAFVPDTEVVAERAAWRDAFLAEVLRIVEIEVEALSSGDTERYDTAIGLVEDLTRPSRKPAARGSAKKKLTARTAPKPAPKPAKKSARGAAKKAATRAKPPAAAIKARTTTRPTARAKPAKPAATRRARR